IAYQHLSSRVPPPSTISAGVPAELDRAVLHATEKDPNARPASARAFHGEVARIQPMVEAAPPVAALAAQLPATDGPGEDRAATVTIPRAQTPRARRARRLRWLAVLAFVLAALGLGAWAV